MTGWSWRGWGALVLGAAGVLLLIEHLWVTDAEAIADRCATLGAAMEDGDIDATMDSLDPDFNWGGITRGWMRLVLGFVTKSYPTTQATPIEIDTAITGDTATSEVVWKVSAREQGRRIPGTLTMHMRWRRDADDGWRCTTFTADSTHPLLELLGGFRKEISPAFIKRRVRELAGF